MVWLPVAALALGVGGGMPVVSAVEPPSAVQPQSPEVEAIIKQLEAKAAAMEGTWTITFGRQGHSRDPLETLLQGGAPGASGLPLKPLLQMLANCCTAMAPTCFRCPEALRFQMDTVLGGNVYGADGGWLVLLANLQPRLFLQNLGGLAKVGEETIDGVKLVHLQGDLAKNSPALAKTKWSSYLPPLPVVDVYVDPGKTTIARLELHSKQQPVRQMVVGGWEAIGSSSTWPKSVTGRVIIAGPVGAKDADKPMVLQVQGFASGETKPLEEVQRQITAAPFFATPEPAIRPAAHYRSVLAQHPESLSDRVALTQALLVDSQTDLAEAMAQWKQVETSLADPKVRGPLTQTLAPYGASAVRWMEPRVIRSQAAASIALMGRLQEQLDDPHFATVAPAVQHVWQALHETPETRALVKSMDGPLLERFVRTGGIYVFRTLVKMSNHDKLDAALIEPALDSVLRTALPKTGFAESPLACLVLASITEDDLQRAKRYLSAPVWPEGIPKNERQVPGLLRQSIELAQQLRDGRDAALGPAIDAFQAFGQGAAANDTHDGFYGRWLLTNSAERLLQARMADGKAPQPVDLMTATVARAGAAEYWKQIIDSLVGQNLQKPQFLVGKIGPLVSGYGQTFKATKFAFSIWEAAGSDRTLRKEYIALSLDYYGRALAAATDDASRVKVILGIGQDYMALRQFDRATQAIEGSRQLVHDAEQLKKLTDAVTRIQQQRDQVARNEVAEAAKVQQARQQGQIEFLQTRRQEAVMQGRSTEDIKAIDDLFTNK